MPVERSVGFEDAQYHLIAFQRNDLSRWALQSSMSRNVSGGLPPTADSLGRED
jgi:hypothetical protein